MWEEPSCWLKANWKVPKLDPSLPAPLPSGKKMGKERKKENLIKIFKMELHETDLQPCEKKKTYTYWQQRFLQSVESIKKRWLVLNVKARRCNACWAKCSMTYIQNGVSTINLQQSQRRRYVSAHFIKFSAFFVSLWYAMKGSVNQRHMLDYLLQAW